MITNIMVHMEAYIENRCLVAAGGRTDGSVDRIGIATRRHPGRTPTAMLILALLLTACGSGGESTEVDADGALSIVATTSILADVAGQVAGDSARVTTLMEPGADPHNFEASAQQLAALQEADLIVANGANLEEHLTAPLAEVERAGVPVFSATDHIATLTFTGDGQQEAAHAGEDDQHAGDGHDDEAGGVDPHFWMDPIRMADVSRALGEQIGELSGDPDAITGHAQEYAARLEELDADINETLAPIPDDARTLVTNHEAFNYFADRYGFTIVGTVIPSLSTGAEPSARDLEELVHTIEQHQVRAVFTEATAPEQLTQALAAEVGTDVQIVELHSETLGEEGSGVSTYADMLAANAELVAQALGG
jgi:zinc/manganese transport system substrate-binding protein